jgi:hypothetical protein
MYSLQVHHKYSLSELENMMPWEMTIYVNLVQETLRKQEREQTNLIDLP